MAEPSEDTKKTATSMMSGIGKSFLGGAKKVVSSVGKLFIKKPESVIPKVNSNPTETLGEIFKMMKIMDEDRRANQEMANAHIEEQKHEKDRRNDEIIKALTARKPAKPPKRKKEKKVVEEKKVPEKKAPEKKVEEKKVEEKKAPEKKAPEKKAEDKAAKDKADKEAKDKSDKAAKDKADKEAKEKAETARKEEEAKKARETAERIKKEEEAKKARETAERVKKEETKAPSETAIGAVTKEVTPILGAAGAAGAAVTIGVGAGALLMPSQTVAAAINKASDTVGVSRPLMYAMAKQESSFDPNAGASTSSAKGLYQFIKGTWADMVKKYGDKYPILKQRGPEDPEANAIAGALFIKENSQILKKANIPINATTIYTAHFLGPGGAKKLFSLDPDTIAANSLPDAAKANDFIFYKKDAKTKKIDKNNPRTVKEITEILFEKVGQYEDKYAKALNVSSNVSGSQIDQSSKSNTDMKKEMNAQQASEKQQNINVVNQNTTEQQNTPPKQKDVNPLLAKGQAK